MGLVNRLVPPGQALEEAVSLASSSPRSPRRACATTAARCCGSGGCTEPDALALEARFGLDTIASGETRQGAARFASGAGRHGAPVEEPARGAAEPVTAPTRHGPSAPVTERVPGRDVVAAFDFDGTLTRGGSVWKFLSSLCGRGAVVSAGDRAARPSWCVPPCSGARPPTRPRRRCSCAPWRGAPPTTSPRGPQPSESPITATATAPRSGPDSTGTAARAIASSWCRLRPSTTSKPVGGRARGGRGRGDPLGGGPRREAHRAIRRRQLPRGKEARTSGAVDGDLARTPGPDGEGALDVTSHNAGRGRICGPMATAPVTSKCSGGRHRGRRRAPGPVRQAAAVPSAGGRPHRLVSGAGPDADAQRGRNSQLGAPERHLRRWSPSSARTDVRIDGSTGDECVDVEEQAVADLASPTTSTTVVSPEALRQSFEAVPARGVHPG